MTAVILAFPPLSPIRALTRATGEAPPFTPDWCAQHLPLVAAAMDLLRTDDAEFARRFRLIREAEGRAIVGELAGQLQRLGAHIADIADGLSLTAERIRDAMTAQGALL